jgi:hypothetical protein
MPAVAVPAMISGLREPFRLDECLQSRRRCGGARPEMPDRKAVVAVYRRAQAGRPCEGIIRRETNRADFEQIAGDGHGQVSHLA